jgi:hypothetical protein
MIGLFTAHWSLVCINKLLNNKNLNACECLLICHLFQSVKALCFSSSAWISRQWLAETDDQRRDDTLQGNHVSREITLNLVFFQ